MKWQTRFVAKCFLLELNLNSLLSSKLTHLMSWISLSRLQLSDLYKNNSFASSHVKHRVYENALRLNCQ